MNSLSWGLEVCPNLKKAVQVLGAFFALLLISFPTFSQVNLGRINGTVTDQSGGVVAGATVTVLDVERGVPRTLTTDDAGAYSAPALIPGAYTVRVEAKGFSTVERKDVAVGVGIEVRVDLTLAPGEQTQLVTVTGELPEVNTTNAQLGGTISNQVITDLPVEGRTFISLANYQPGTMSKPGGGGGLVQYTNGMRPDYTVYVFDGIMDVNSFGTAGPLNLGYQAGGPDESVIVSVDAIQEINFVETPKAEYGWRPGASENVGLKSGTNTLHGTAFAIGRNTGMDSRNAYAFSGNPQVPSPAPVEYIQYGATVGGPIKKDRLFYLFSYEAVTYNVGNPKNFTMPTLVSLGGGATGAKGSFPDAIAAMNTAGVTISPLSLKLAGCTAAGVCTANAGLFANTLTTTTYPTDFLDTGNSRNGIGKLDYHMNDKNSFNVDYFQGYGHIIAPVGSVTQPYWSSPIIGSVTVGRAVWSYVPNTSVVNEVRAGWDYSLQAANAAADCNPSANAPNYANLGFVSGVNPACAFPTLTINGFGILGQPQGVSYKCITYSVLDNISITKGDHQFKLGVQYSHLFFDAIPSVNLLKGTLQFNAAALTGTPGITAANATALEAFLNGDIFSESIQVGNLRRTGAYDQMAAYIQDDWRVFPRLTLNLGLRWEHTTPITTQNNQMAVFNPTAPGGLQQEAGNTLYSLPMAIGPRFGLAWDVTGKGTTVVHSGFSVMYYEPTAADFMNTTTTALGTNPTGGSYQTVAGGALTPFGGTINVQNKTLIAPVGGFPWASGTAVYNAAALAPVCGPASPNSPCKAYGVGHLTMPQFLEWNFGIQHAFTSSTTLEVAYVGNHGQHQFQELDVNQATPGANGAANEQLRRPYHGQFPYFSNIIILSNPARSNYNGLQVKLTQRVNHGVTFNASYAYAHSFDSETSETAIGVPQNSLNPQGDYGNSSLDIRHRFTFQGTYQIPGVKSPLHVLEGWQVTTAVQILSALPFNAVDTGDDISGTGENLDRWDLIGTASDFKATGRAAFPYFSGVSNAACATAAGNLPNGPTGLTATASLTKYGCYAEGSSMLLPPAQGNFGTLNRFGLRGTGFRVWDMTLAKNIVLKERLTAQFRVECYNILNSVQFAVPSSNPGSPGSFGLAAGTPNIVANSPIIGSGDARRFQLGLKFNF